MKDTEQTLVVFRKWGNGEIIALFPEDSEKPGECLSYMHIGQHSSASYSWCMNRTKKASPEEFNALRQELESIGYNLKICEKYIRRK